MSKLTEFREKYKNVSPKEWYSDKFTDLRKEFNQIIIDEIDRMDHMPLKEYIEEFDKLRTHHIPITFIFGDDRNPIVKKGTLHHHISMVNARLSKIEEVLNIDKFDNERYLDIMNNITDEDE